MKKNENTWRLNKMLLNNKQVNKEIKEIVKRYLETNKNTNTQNLWATAKAVLRRKYIAILAYPKKEEKPAINILNLHIKNQRKNNKAQSYSLRKEITKIRVDIYEIELRKTTKKINKAKSWFFENINKIDKPLTILIKKK